MLTVGGEFDGIGLLAHGLHRAGLRHSWLCEIDPWRRSILARRFPGVPIFDDVRAVGLGTAARVDVIAGGFPCKGASTAGNRAGLDHPETALWREMRRSVGELRPRYVLVENVANLLAVRDGGVWGEVLGDLAALGYRVWWDCWPAAAFGAPHLRDRLIAIAAHPDESRADTYAAAGGSRSPVGERAGAATHAKAAGRLAPERKGQQRGVGRDARTGGAGVAADAVGSGGPAGRGREREGPGESGAWRGNHAEPSDQPPADAARDAEGGAAAPTGTVGERAGTRAVAVEWGEYRPAIRRWEAIAGPAPEPLVRRVDDGPADVRRLWARVERSRLSALGDGVQLQLGEFAGRLLLSLEAERMSRAAA